MKPSRLEAFSDGVIAIIITIMVLELKVPHSPSFAALYDMGPVFLCYVVSFLYIGIYWNNHHHLLHTVQHVSGPILWANLHLLFWLSLVPFFTGWMGENNFAPVPTAMYGGVLVMAAVAYTILSRAIIADQGEDSLLRRAIGKDCKGILSLVAYVLAVPLAFVNCWLSMAIYILVALIWIVPDKRIESLLESVRQ
jgi:uncharacterized membrane protein